MALLIILLAGCRKEVSFESNIGYYENTYVMKSSYPTQLKTPSGLLIKFPADAFVRKSDGVSVNGDVSLVVKEILSPGAMIFKNKPSQSAGRPLESGGEFYIGATSSANEPLKLAAGKLVEMRLPPVSYSMNGMFVFKGEEGPGGVVNWQLNNGSGVRVSNRDTSGARDGYYMFSDQIDWINCDRYPTEPKITYTVNTGNCPDRDSTSVYVHFTGRNSVTTIYPVNGSFRSDYLVTTPATIIGICQKNGQFFLSATKVSLQNGGETTMQFSSTNQEALKARLAQLH